MSQKFWTGRPPMPPSASNQPLLVSMECDQVYESSVVKPLAKRCWALTWSALYLDMPMSSE